jgi:hypothetical protein
LNCFLYTKIGDRFDSYEKNQKFGECFNKLALQINWIRDGQRGYKSTPSLEFPQNPFNGEIGKKIGKKKENFKIQDNLLTKLKR